MIQVTVYRDSGKKTFGFQVSGHSGYARQGKDIVCSAVSALTHNTIASIEKFTTDEVKYCAVNDKEGFLRYELKKVSKESGLLFDSMVLGLQSIAEDYGKFVQIRFEEE